MDSYFLKFNIWILDQRFNILKAILFFNFKILEYLIEYSDGYRDKMANILPLLSSE